MGVASQFRFLHKFKCFNRRSLNGLSQKFKELDVEIVVWFNFVIEFWVFWNVRNVKLKQNVNQLIHVLVSPYQISLN